MNFANSFDKRFEAFGVLFSPLFVPNTDKFQIERRRMSHIGTYFSPSCIYITIGKFYKVERILNITIQVANSDMSLRGTILILTGQSAIQNRKRCRPHFLGQQEVFIKSQSVALVIIREETVGKRILPAILIQRTILYRTYRLLPVITGCQIRPFHNTTLRETGQTVVPMVAGVVSVVVNLCFNTLLIFGYLGFPRLGASGAAIATVIARFVEAGVVMLWAHRNPERVPYLRGVYRSFHIPAALARAIARKSIPLLLNETLWAAGMALLAQCYSVRGYDVVSAYNICSTVSNVFNVAFMAMGNAVGILVGQLLGAGKMEEAVDTDRKLITFSVGICIVLGGLMALVAHLFPQIYNTSDSIRDLAAAFIRICALCMPINALANACYFTLRSGGKTFVTFLFDSFYVCVLTVPMAFVLSRFTGLPIVPLFLCCQLADIGKCVVGLIMIRRGVWIQNIVGKEAA